MPVQSWTRTTRSAQRAPDIVNVADTKRLIAGTHVLSNWVFCLTKEVVPSENSTRFHSL